MTRSSLLAASVLGLSLVSATSFLQGQEVPNGGRGFRVPPPGMVGRFNYGNNEFSIADHPAIQKELKLTDDQKAKVKDICDAFQKASVVDYPADQKYIDRETQMKLLAEKGKKAEEFTKERLPELQAILDDEQKTRLSQIVLQLQGSGVYSRPEVQAKLEITADQKEKLAAVYEEYLSKRREQSAAPPRRDDGSVDQEASNKTRKELMENWGKACRDVLTPAQNEKLEALKGREFDQMLLQRGLSGPPGAGPGRGPGPAARPGPGGAPGTGPAAKPGSEGPAPKKAD